MKIFYKIVLPMFLLTTYSIDAQEKKYNSKVDNWRYWKELAEQKIVPYNPDNPPKKPVTKGEKINTTMGLADSPDIVLLSGGNISQSENSVFINPNNNQIVLNSNNSVSNGIVQGTNALFSFDGGNTWLGGTGGAGGNNSGDPAVAINNSGVSFIGHISAGFNQGVSISNDNGSTWTANNVSNILGSLDKNHMWVDNSITSPFQDRIYSTWTNFNGVNNNQIEFTRSSNNGTTWSTPINISANVNAGSHNQGVSIQTGPNGEVYAVWAIYDAWPSRESAIGFAMSTNGGLSFDPSSRILNNIRGIRWQPGFNGTLGNPHGKNMRTNSFPVMSVDISGGANNGNIYVVWSNQGTPGVNTGNDISVYLIKSTDGGNTWSNPIRVNQDPIGNVQYFPWITCDPVTGDLSVIFYDDRDTGEDEIEAWVATSSDGGDTWDDFRVSDVAFTPAPIPGLAGGYMGDYLGIAARDGLVYPVWTDNRSGQTLTYTSPFQLESSCQEYVTITQDVLNGDNDFQEAEIELIAVNKIFPGGSSSYQAGESVKLKPGFNAIFGSYFRAYIDGCNQKQIKSVNTDKNLAISSKARIIPQYKKSKNEIIIKSYPNPTTGIVTIELDNNALDESIRVEMYSMSRGLILTKEFNQKLLNDINQIKLDITSFNRGIYFLKINSKNNTYSTKIIKE